MDLRRAISAAYYAVFHATLAAAADQYVGASKRTTSHYGLVYRSVDHKDISDVCLEVRRPQLSAKLSRYAPSGGFDADTKAYANAVTELKQRRDDADYNPLIRVKSSDAQLALRTAYSALHHLRTMQVASREAFLGLLLFKAR